MGDYLLENSVRKASEPALVCADRTLNWSELNGEVQRASAGLSPRLRSDKQQVVSLLFANSWEFVVAYLAIVHAGHIALPLDPTYKELELNAIIKQVKPVFVITNPDYAHKISQGQIIMLKDLPANAKHKPDLLRLDPAEQIASLTFTSGTTGKPKLAPYTHANHIWNIVVCSKVWGWDGRDKLLISLPLSHWYGLVMGLSGALYHGNTLYLHEWFDPKASLETLAGGEISMFTHFPLAYAQMLETPANKDYNLSKTRVLISGGAPLPPAISSKFKERFGVNILETYGSSESGRIAANSAKDHLAGSPGVVLPGVEVKLSDSSEVLIKSPGVFPGYYDNSEATAANLDEAGWWHTGDLGRLDGQRLFLSGRVQEKIRRFGYSLSPRDIEWALQQFNKIRAVYVMGVQRPDQPNDELIYFVEGHASVEQIRSFCKTNLPYSWRPDRIILLDGIPRTRSGKTRLTALKDLLNKQPVTVGGRSE